MIDTVSAPESPAEKPALEKVVFDKAEQAESIEKLRSKYEETGKEIEQGKENLSAATEPTQREELAASVERLEKKRHALAEIIKRREAEQN